MSATKRCPYCANEIMADAIKCRYCGEWLNKPTPSSPNLDAITLIRQALGSQYDVEGVIGKGGMATVYKACQKSLGRDVAIKVIHQNLVHDNEFVERFLREAQIGASLNHPNIITVYDVGSIDNVHYMVMEYLEGVSLLSKVKQCVLLDFKDVVDSLNPIANALGYIHSHGIFHCDVKTENIFITTLGRPVLTGFSTAQKAIDTTASESLFGTAEYVSPESALGKNFDGRSDLFSFGIVLYECLCGHVPFRSYQALNTRYQIMYNSIPKISSINSDMPPWMTEMLVRLLEKDPKLRPKSGYEIERIMNQEISDMHFSKKYNCGGLFPTTGIHELSKVKNQQNNIGNKER